MSSPSRLSTLEEKIEEFCILTGVPVEMARLLLDACGNDLQMAVNLHLEGEASSTSADQESLGFSPEVATGSNQNTVEEGRVRSPIPPREERLVDATLEYRFSSRSFKRGAPRTNGWVNPFRDYQVETDRQEALLTGQGPSGSLPKVRRLEDLFRPPLGMMFAGTFQAARDAGVKRNRWLMVNVQKQTEFPCQVMNRDIWSNAAIESIVKAHFVFFQVESDSDEGRHYCQFYPVNSFPYVSVIDPRTGELLKFWTNFEPPYFAETLLAFLSNNATPTPEEDSPVKRSGDGDEFGPTASLPSGVETVEERRPSYDYQDDDFGFDYGNLTENEDDEEEDDDDEGGADVDGKNSGSGEGAVGGQGGVAVASSGTLDASNVSARRSGGGVGTPSSSGGSDNSDTTQADGCDTSAKASSSDELDSSAGPTTGRAAGRTSVSGITTLFNASRMDTPPPEEPVPSVTLSLKFPGDRREVVTFPATDCVASLQNYLVKSGYPMIDYDYVTFFPKRTLSTHEARVTTLASLGIVHNETIFIQLRDLEEEQYD